MTRLDWSTAGSRYYEAGVDRGVLYLPDKPGVVWNGLTDVTENPSGGDANPFYQDGIKYSNNSNPEELEMTISAFTYPQEFAECNGNAQPRSGLYIAQQRRKSFGLTYRTMIGNDLESDAGYRIHIIYNATVSPTSEAHQSFSDKMDPMEFSWGITTLPERIPGYRPTSHVVIDTRNTDPEIVTLIEDILYGTEADTARLPSFSDILAAYDTISTLTITDNGDGTWTATAPFDVIRMIDDDTFEITSNTATYLDEDTYTISSE